MDFVHTYANELVEMLVADLSPQEVCVYLKLCEDKGPRHHNIGLVHQPNRIEQINAVDLTCKFFITNVYNILKQIFFSD